MLLNRIFVNTPKYLEKMTDQKKKIILWLPVLLSVVMVVGMTIGYQLRDNTAGGKFLGFSGRSSVQELVSLINSKYVDPVASDSINALVADALLSHLDPHSAYIPAKDLEALNDDIAGSFMGIGIEFQLLKDTLNVMNVFKDGPSFKAGLQVGDQILTANDTLQLFGKNINADWIRSKIRGPEGSTIKITVLRDQKKQNFTITRGVIPVSPIDAAYMMQPNIGYIKINKFSERTYESFMESLEKLQKAGMKSLLLDLRGNGGGLLQEAVDIADEFLSDNKLIVYTEGINSKRNDFVCKRPGLFETGKLTVLIDETSASASEVLAGALQDWDRATIIGRRSFGKGLVQQQFGLTDGSAVRLTIARYYTPLGRNIQKTYAVGKEKYEQELEDRYHSGLLDKPDSSVLKGKKFKTPGGHILYGGGGITPDIIVPIAASLQDTLIMQLYLSNTLSNFVYELYKNNRTYFTAFKTPQEFDAKFYPGNVEWNAFVAAAAKDQIVANKVSVAGKTYLLQTIKVLMARQIWRSEGYYQLLNRTDSTVAKALQQIN
jgi:carboxyl-terminal processing protease